MKLKSQDFPDVWRVLTYTQRVVLAQALSSDLSVNYTKSWLELSERVRLELVKLDWNFMLGGVLEPILKGENKNATRNEQRSKARRSFHG